MYVHDPVRGSTVPIVISCPLTIGIIMWSLEEPLGNNRIVIQNNQLLANMTVIIHISGIQIILSDILQSKVSLLVCSNSVQEFTIRLTQGWFCVCVYFFCNKYIFMILVNATILFH